MAGDLVLVTGGTGTLGRRVVARLHRSSRPVAVLSRRPGPVVAVRLPGAVSAGYRRGHHLAPQAPNGRQTFAEWLAQGGARG